MTANLALVNLFALHCVPFFTMFSESQYLHCIPIHILSISYMYPININLASFPVKLNQVITEYSRGAKNDVLEIKSVLELS